MPKTIERKDSYRDLTPKMRAIVDAVVEQPNATVASLASAASDSLPDGESVSESYVRDVRRKQDHIIDNRAEMVMNERYEGSETVDGDPFEGILKGDTDQWQKIANRPVKQTQGERDADAPTDGESTGMTGPGTANTPGKGATMRFDLSETDVYDILDGDLPDGVRDAVIERVVEQAFDAQKSAT